jgi:hypothetical protein
MDEEKNGGRLLRRPKLTLSCSAEGKEGRKEILMQRTKSKFLWFILRRCR